MKKLCLIFIMSLISSLIIFSLFIRNYPLSAYANQSEDEILSKYEMMTLVGGTGCNERCVAAGSGCGGYSTGCSEAGESCVVCAIQGTSVCVGPNGTYCQDDEIPCTGRDSSCILTLSGYVCSGGGPLIVCGYSPFCD